LEQKIRYLEELLNCFVHAVKASGVQNIIDWIPLTFTVQYGKYFFKIPFTGEKAYKTETS